MYLETKYNLKNLKKKEGMISFVISSVGQLGIILKRIRMMMFHQERYIICGK